MREEKRLVKRVILSFIPFSRIPILEILVEIHSECLEIHFNFSSEILFRGKLLSDKVQLCTAIFTDY